MRRRVLFQLLGVLLSIGIAQAEGMGDAHVDVKTFGAKGDGLTDDTLAIQGAINTAGHTKAVFFPPGTYKITSTLRISRTGANGAHLLGPSRPGYFGGAHGSVLNYHGDGTAIQVGTEDGNPDAVGFTYDALVQHLAIVNKASGQVGIALANTNRSAVIGCEIVGFALAGIRPSGGNVMLSLTQNKIFGDRGDGSGILFGDYQFGNNFSVVRDNLIIQYKYGITVSQGRHFILETNLLEVLSSSAFRIGPTVAWITHLIIQRNYIETVKEYGFVQDSSFRGEIHNMVVTDNAFYGSGDAAYSPAWGNLQKARVFGVDEHGNYLLTDAAVAGHLASSSLFRSPSSPQGGGLGTK